MLTKTKQPQNVLGNYHKSFCGLYMQKQKRLRNHNFAKPFCGSWGIRTPGTVARTSV